MLPPAVSLNDKLVKPDCLNTLIGDATMNYQALILLITALLLATGCAARNQVVIDPSGVQMERYQADLAQCKQIAMQVEQKALGGAVGGALAGALIGASLGNSKTAKKIAGAGAVTGTARAAHSTKKERLKVTKNCLRNRGYTVLN